MKQQSKQVKRLRQELSGKTSSHRTQNLWLYSKPKEDSRMYNSEGCAATQKYLNEKIDRQETRLNDHSRRLDIVEQNAKADAVRIENLCKQIGSLVSVMKWFLTAIVGGIIAFFFAALEKGLL